MSTTTATKTRCALVLKPITRCEFGGRGQGFLCEVFDRVEVIRDLGTFGGRTHTVLCRAADGTKFSATTNGADPMVQLD